MRTASTSANFDLVDVRPFLERLKLPAAVVNDVETWIRSLQPQDEQGVHFEMNWEGKAAKVTIGCYMDDIDAPDIEFRGPKSFIANVEFELEMFMEERGK